MDHLLRNNDPIVVDLSYQKLSETATVMVSAAATGKPDINNQLCAPAEFYAMPSIAYRLAKVAAGDGVCGISLYPVSAHDVVAGHALLIGAKGVLIGEDGSPIHYTTESTMMKVSGRVFGGAPSACSELNKRDWQRVFE
jgi:myo-inositol-1(or 4)-monophosphatase